MAIKKNKEEEHLERVRARAEIDRLRGDDDAGRVHASPFSISSIRSGTFNSLMVKIVMGLLVFIFAVGFMLTSLGTNEVGPGQTHPTGPVASLGGQKIERNAFESAAAQQEQFMSQFGQSTGPAELMGLRRRTLQQFTDRAALIEAAKAAGLTATDAEIDKKINELIDEQIKAQKEQSEADFRRRIESQFGSMEEFRQKAHEGYDHNAVRDQILLDKLEKKIKDETKAGEAEYKRSQTKLNLRQIVVRPKLPAPNAKDAEAEKKKNEADAKARADQLAAALKAKPTLENFTETAKTKSDDIATKIKGGQVGWKLPAELPYPEEIKQALVNAGGKIVGPLQDEITKEYYIFFIEGRAERLPADYAKKKQEYLKKFKEDEQNKAWTQYQEEARKQYDAQIEDPALKAYKIQTEDVFQAAPDQQDELRQQALKLYQQAIQSTQGPVANAIHYQMALLYRDLKQPAKELEELRAAAKDSPQPSQVDLELVRALEANKQQDEALKKLGELSKKLDEAPPSASPFGNPSDILRSQIAMEYEKLGKKELADQERKKMSAPGGMGGFGGGNPITINPPG